jgi:hypothetical protein
MKKLLSIAIALSLAVPVYAVGPKIRYRILTWTPSPSPTVSGYWLYWRTGTTVFSDANRYPVSTNGNTFDLMTLALTPGTYAFAMSSTNLVGDESALSNEAQWNSVLPIKPVITGITEP